MNRVKRSFIEKVMCRMGFIDEWVSLVMGCVRTINYFVLFNGVQEEEFRPHKRLRQGDLLSPYLFFIFMRAFFTLLKMAKAKGTIKGIRVGRSGLFLTHLFFADHSILFREASLNRASAIKSIVTEYEGVLRQLINFEKSLIFFSKNVSRDIREHIGAVLSMIVSYHAEKYLSLSTMVGRQKKEAFASFKDRFVKHIESRSVHHLSLGVIKAKYYLNNDFTSVNLGSHSLYIWRSIWGGRRLLELGMGWKGLDKEWIQMTAKWGCDNINRGRVKQDTLLQSLYKKLWRLRVAIGGGELLPFLSLNGRVDEPHFSGLFVHQMCPAVFGIIETRSIIMVKDSVFRFNSFVKAYHTENSNWGYILVTCTYPNNFVADATTNEARACLDAVTVAEKLGFQMLVVKGDSLTVVKKFQSLGEERSNRLVNQRAHAMAMEGKQWSLLRVWIEEAPLR
ncbi:hypothetical protein Gohar_001282, partial [Gossypium harknessii]|nr:hypothetical protein [Gossypium harknessii]